MLGQGRPMPHPHPLGPHWTPLFSQALDETLVPGLWRRQGMDLGFGVQGQRPSSGTHPSVLPSSDTRPHFHGSPNLWRLSGGRGEKQVAHGGAVRAWHGVPSPLDLPPIPSDSLKICSLQGLGVRLDLSPWLVLPPSPLTTLVSQLYPAKALLSPRSQRPLALRYLKRGPASG